MIRAWLLGTGRNGGPVWGGGGAACRWCARARILYKPWWCGITDSRHDGGAFVISCNPAPVLKASKQCMLHDDVLHDDATKSPRILDLITPLLPSYPCLIYCLSLLHLLSSRYWKRRKGKEERAERRTACYLTPAAGECIDHRDVHTHPSLPCFKLVIYSIT